MQVPVFSLKRCHFSKGFKGEQRGRSEELSEGVAQAPAHRRGGTRRAFRNWLRFCKLKNRVETDCEPRGHDRKNRKTKDDEIPRCPPLRARCSGSGGPPRLSNDPGERARDGPPFSLRRLAGFGAFRLAKGRCGIPKSRKRKTRCVSISERGRQPVHNVCQWLHAGHSARGSEHKKNPGQAGPEASPGMPSSGRGPSQAQEDAAPLKARAETLRLASTLASPFPQ